MSKFEKLQKNIDNKLLTIKYIGSRGEGVSNLTTEINYRVNNYTFFIPFTLPDETVVVKNGEFIVSFGDLTIAQGKEVTINSGGNWTIK